MKLQLVRWAKRVGKTVSWGNIVGPYSGQSFLEIFQTIDEARERERQALAKEPIGSDRLPVALSREEI